MYIFDAIFIWLDFIFFFLLSIWSQTLKKRWSFNLTESKLLIVSECKLYQWFWSHWSRTVQFSLLTLASIQTGWQLTSHRLWAEKLGLFSHCSTDCFCLSVCLSARVVPFFSPSATVGLLFYCHLADTPKSRSGLLYSSTRGRSAEQTTQGKVVLILLRI